MLRTNEMCEIIRELGGDPEQLTDRTEDDLFKEVMRLAGSKLYNSVCSCGYEADEEQFYKDLAALNGLDAELRGVL